jgi:hypothetical protein
MKNPAPRKIPPQLTRDPEQKSYFVMQAETIRLQGQAIETNAELAKRYTFMVA